MDGHRQFIFWNADRSGIAVRSRSRIRPNTFTGEITVTINKFHTCHISLTNDSSEKLYFFLSVQWLGEARLRSLMEGRIVLVKLLCKDTANARIGVFSPCIAFRVAGSPGNSFDFIPYPYQKSPCRFRNLIHYCLSLSKMICIASHAMGSSLLILRALSLKNHVHLFLDLELEILGKGYEL